MKVFLHYAIVLLLFTGLACAILALVNNQTKPVIEQNQAESENNARSMVLEGAVDFQMNKVQLEDQSELIYYVGKDSKGEILGYTFMAEGKGYSGVIKTMVGVDQNFVIKKILVVQQTETPGLGANCTKEDFNQKFASLGIADLRVDKDGGKIKSISGATITTRAISNSIKLSLEHLKNNLSTVVQDTSKVEKGV